MLIGPPPNVQAGGPPIPNVGAWAQGHLFKAIGKAAKALKDKAKRRSPPADANGGVCKGVEPVHLVTGENYNTHVDFKAFHGAFTWARYTTSARAHESGPVGYGFFHVFQARLDVRLHRVIYFGYQGERIEFPRFLPNQNEMVTNGYRLTRFSDTHFLLEERRLGKMEFRRPNALVNEAVPTAVESKTARATLVYNKAGQLEQIREARNDGVAASAQYQLYYDKDGRLIEVQGCNLERSDGGQPAWVRLVSYSYDAAGDLRIAEDARGLQERYQYDRLHRLIEATDRRDYTFTWQYDLQGRCIGGSGQDGLWRATFEYFPDERKTVMTIHDGSTRSSTTMKTASSPRSWTLTVVSSSACAGMTGESRPKWMRAVGVWSTCTTARERILGASIGLGSSTCRSWRNRRSPTGSGGICPKRLASVPSGHYQMSSARASARRRFGSVVRWSSVRRSARCSTRTRTRARLRRRNASTTPTVAYCARLTRMAAAKRGNTMVPETA